MTLITDPDNLNQSVEVVFDPTASPKKTIQLLVAGNLSNDGVTLQCLYSFCKEEWKSDSTLIKYPFPFTAITEEKFELVNGWDFKDATTKGLIRNGGWALKSDLGVSEEEYAGIITLGTLGGSDQVYYQQVADGAPTNIILTGVVNQAVKVYGDSTHGSLDYRTFFKIFCREYAKTYAQSQLSDIGVSAMTYQVYRFPLTNGTDLNIIADDTTVDQAIAPWNGMSITWYATGQERVIGGTSYYFKVVIDGGQGTKKQIYTWVQRQLRKATDIDQGAGDVIGKTAPALLSFIGDNLYTLLSEASHGTFIDDFQAGDTNSLYFADDSWTTTYVQYPFVASISIQFGDNLKNDAQAKFWVFFTNDDAGANAGDDYGTANAILVNSTATAASLNRAKSGGVGTIETATAHGLAVGDGVRISGMGGTGYNGVFIVASVPDSVHFTFALSGTEGETSDSGGTITKLMVGDVNGNSSKQYSFDYDNNVQRGTGSNGDDAPITVVAIGLATGQFVIATGTIARSTSNVVSLVAALERNYVNPA